MADDKSLFSAMQEFAEKFKQIIDEQKTTSPEDKNNAVICAIVKKMMLSKRMDDEDISSIIQKLEPIYDSGHRHSYSNISSTIYTEKNRTDAECKNQGMDNEVLDVLADNILSLRDAAIKKYSNPEEENKDRYNRILIKYYKLYDHINLETVRLKNYDDQISSALKKIEESSADASRQIQEFNQKIEESSAHIDNKIDEEIEKVKEKTAEMQSQYISILGIFASIVLSFTAGMAFSTSVLDNIYKSSIYRTIIVASLVGMVFIAMIWLLLDFIRNIQGQSKRNWWYLIIPEALLIVMIGFSTFAYKHDLFSGEENITYTIYQNNTEYEEVDNVE